MKQHQAHRNQQATGELKALPRFPSFKISDCKELPQEVYRLTGVVAPLVASAQTHTCRKAPESTQRCYRGGDSSFFIIWCGASKESS
jgi:hypothetical protein